MTINGGQFDSLESNRDPRAVADFARYIPQLLELVNDLVFSLAPNGRRLLFMNRTAERIYGRPIQDILDNGDLWIDCIHPQDRSELLLKLADIGQQPQFDQAFRILQPDQEHRFLQGNFCSILNENDQLMAIGCIAKDVTLGIRAERELEESKAIYHSLVESLPINVFRKDREGRIVFVNNKYCETIGKSRESLLGMTDFDLFEKKLAEKYLRDDRWVLQTGLPFHDIEFHQKDRDEYIYVEVLKAPVTSANGRRIGIQGMFWDVTDRKKAEIELQKAKDLAVAASQAKSDFLANVSHEIRTPLNAVIGMTDLLLGFQADDTQREYLQMIQDSGQSLLTLINDILDFSKIESGKLVLDNEWFDLREKLGDTLRSLTFRAHAKNVDLICNIDPRIPSLVLGDAQRLRQVLVNLVGNSIKFTHQGEICVDVETVSVDQKSTQLKFRIHDTGIGIPEEKLSTIFEEFVQGDTSTTRQYGGTGLGLTIAQQLVELMGGELRVGSRVGMGTEFYFTLEFPLASAGASPVAPLEFADVPVLIMTENRNSRESLECVLKSWRMKTFCVANVSHAFQLTKGMSFAKQPIRIVLAETRKPGRDPEGACDCGSLAEQIAQDPEIEPPVFVGLYKPTTAEDLKSEVSHSVFRRLLMPAKYSELQSAIASCLGMQPAIDGAESDEVPVIPGPCKILLAEDNPINQKLALGILQKFGHTIRVAENGCQAIEALQQERFDLVLMDVQMPEMDGIEAARKIRQLQPPQSQVPIIAMTAHALATDRQRCLESGMDDYLSKPFKASELMELIAYWMDHRNRDSRDVIKDRSGLAAPAKGYVDWNQAFETVGGDRKLLGELIVLFQSEQDRMLTALGLAIDQKNVTAIRSNAHSLKGPLFHLGAQAAAQSAVALETLDSSQLAQAPLFFDQLKAQIQLLTNEFEHFKTSHMTSLK